MSKTLPSARPEPKNRTARGQTVTVGVVTVWMFLLILGFGGRLTRLVTADQITMPIRAFIAGDPSKNHPTWRNVLAYWVSCDWCVGLLIFVGVSFSWAAWGHHLWWTVVAGGFTANLVYASLTQAASATSVIARQAITVLRPPSRGR